MRLSETRWTWVEAAQRGEGEALRDFVEKYRPAIVGYFRRRAEDGVADDLAQEVFLRLFKERVLEQADPAQGRLRSLLFALARNVLGHYLERRQALKRGGGAVHLPVAEEIPAARDDEAEFDRQWLLHLLEKALLRLEESHPRYYEVLRRCLEEPDRREVARALEVTPNNLKSLVHRAKDRLRQHLQSLVEEYSAHPAEFEAELRTLAQLFQG